VSALAVQLLSGSPPAGAAVVEEPRVRDNELYSVCETCRARPEPIDADVVLGVELVG
jgi:hypothetical protein